MRFMMLMMPKGYEKAEPGAMPDAKAGGEGSGRRLLDDSGEVEGRSGRMGFAMPRRTTK